MMGATIKVQVKIDGGSVIDDIYYPNDFSRGYEEVVSVSEQITDVELRQWLLDNLDLIINKFKQDGLITDG